MLRAVRLAENGRGATGPNPLVGALVVKRGKIRGRGWYAGFGCPHAEAKAIAMAGSEARGAALYVTMEPCHTTGKTPPCTRVIAASGIKSVTVGLADPSQRGRGIRELERRGIRVNLGIQADRIRAQNADFFKSRRLKRPVVTLKLAMTLDGRIADRKGRSKWISSAAARGWTRNLRGRMDAVMVGAGTAAADDPGLSAPQAGRNPLRIVVDADARTDPGLKMLRLGRTLVAVGPHAPARRVGALQLAGADILRIPAGPAREGRKGLNLRALLRALYSEGVGTILCEGGGRLAGTLLDEGLLDRLVLVLAPRILGDARAIPGFSGKARRLGDAARFHIEREIPIGTDLILDAAPVRGEG